LHGSADAKSSAPRQPKRRLKHPSDPLSWLYVSAWPSVITLKSKRKREFMSLRVFLLFCLMACLAAPLGAEESSIPAVPKDDRAFTLGPGDIVQISVWREEELSRDVLVRPDGLISFPLIEDINANGLSIEELKARVEEQIKEYVPGSPVSVTLSQLGSQRVYVIGEVANPGTFLMQSQMRVMQLLAMAGGLSPYAGESKIVILRQGPGGEEYLRFNYNDVAKGRDLEQNILLKPNDTIIVP
jgi:polysaccharide export outer membrane protein